MNEQKKKKIIKIAAGASLAFAGAVVGMYIGSHYMPRVTYNAICKKFPKSVIVPEINAEDNMLRLDVFYTSRDRKSGMKIADFIFTNHDDAKKFVDRCLELIAKQEKAL